MLNDEHGLKYRGYKPFLRWFDVFPVHYVGLLLPTGYGATFLFKEKYALFLLACIGISIPIFILALKKISALQQRLFEARLVEPLKLAVIIVIKDEIPKEKYRFWIRTCASLAIVYLCSILFFSML